MEITEINGLTEEQIAGVTKLIQSETDKVRTDYSGKLKLANEELDKYKPANKSESELQFEARIKALEDRENELNAKERTNTIASKLKEKGLPAELYSIVNVGEDIDADIEKVAGALSAYFLNSNYKPESHASNKGITKDQFKKMSYLERTKLFQENPELYKILAQ